MKRFWKEVAVTSERGIALDARPVRTPGRVPLILPTAALAEAVATEWRDVGDTVQPAAMPLTGLANAAIDRITPDPAAFAAGLAQYGESDLLYYRAETPAELVERQQAAWDPILAWARGRYDVHFVTATGILFLAQPEATVARLGEAVVAHDPFALAALSPLVTLTGSLILALAVAEGAVAPAEAWAAAHVDEDWQAEQWGKDQLATDRQTIRQIEFAAAIDFLALSRPSASARG